MKLIYDTATSVAAGVSVPNGGGGPVSAPVPCCALGLMFAHVAAERDMATALISGSDRLSYAALEKASNQVARYLTAEGVGPGDVVALALPRSATMVTALLGIVKAGAAYLPLDPHHPVERLRFMIADSGAQVLIATPALAEALELPDDVRHLCPACEHAAIEHLSADPLEPVEAARAAPHSLAYVMYTSGSTGQPKGSDVTHANVLNLAWRPSYADITPDDTLLQAAAVAFDAATFEIWGALLNGARLVLAPEGPMDLDRIATLMRSEGVTIAWLTAGLFGEVAEHHLPMLAGLRQLLVGGDVLPVPAVARVRAAYPQLRLTNGYGPTETTTFACTHDIAQIDDKHAPIPIGRPIRNVVVHILDEAGDPVAPGTTGEIHIGGTGVSRGYRNRPALNAERFLPDRFSPSARMYRTGDLGRWRPDGAIDFLGRADGQVKLRGFRIELGEIESALGALDGIAQASVQLRQVNGDARLIAYLVARADQCPPAAEALRAALHRTLPDHMIPQAFILLDRLPLTANGKVDRAALPDPAGRSTAPVAPATDGEQLVCDLFRAICAIGDVGVDEDFFLIGGHSLAAMRLVATLRDTVGKALPLAAIFRLRTPRAIAAELAALTPIADDPNAGEGWDAGRPRLSAVQRRLWALDHLPGQSQAYIIPIAFDLVGALDADVLGQALADVVARHLPLRTGIATDIGAPVAIVREHAADAILARHDLADLSEAEQEAAIAHGTDAATKARFDLAREPMLRALLFRRSANRHRLLLQLHHGAADGASLPVLLEDIAIAYAARASGNLPDFAPLRFDLADFFAWQTRTLADSGEGERQLDFWRRELAGLSGDPLATDMVRHAQRSHAAVAVPITLAPAEAAALAARAAALRTTPVALLVASYAAAVAPLAASELVVGVACAGRTHPGVDRLVGCLADLLPLRLDCARPEAMDDLTVQVRDRLERALAHGDVPFDRIVTASGVRRSADHVPLVHCAFTWLDRAPHASLALPGIVATAHPSFPTHAKFDLTLALSPTADGAIAGHLEYDASLFAPARAQAIADGIVGLPRAEPVAPPQMLHPRVAPATGDRRADDPASDAPLFATVRNLFVEITGTAAPGRNDDFFELGGDSLSAIRLTARLEAIAGHRIALEHFFRAPTIAGCLQALARADAAPATAHLLPLQPDGSKPPFFCVHGIGGNAMVFRHLAPHMADRPLLGLRSLPDDPLDEPVEAIAARYVAAVRAHQPHGPYRIGGYSFGGALAFEMGRQLIAAGEQVALLTIIDARWPGWHASWRNLVPAALLWADNLGHVALQELRTFSAPRWQNKARRVLRAVMRKLRDQPATVVDVIDLDFAPSAERAVYESHWRALRDYAPDPCTMPVALLRSRAQPVSAPWSDRSFGWQDTSSQRVPVTVVAGNHLSMLDARNADALARELLATLDAGDAAIPHKNG